jgi:hypothetical protein
MLMGDTTPHLITAGTIAQRLGVQFYAVQYVLRVRPSIRPLALAGHVRLYSPTAIEQVRAELKVISQRHALKSAHLVSMQGGAQ